MQPSNRPAGSTQVLRFTGLVVQDTANLTVYPKTQASYPANAATGALTGVRFLLADSTDTTDTQKKLPEHVFDDAQPAADCPHDPVAGTGVLNATDQNISARTWCQNLRVVFTPRTPTAVTAISAWDPSATKVCLDEGASSGLGRNTGFPVVVIGIFFSGQNVPINFDADIIFEVRATGHR